MTTPSEEFRAKIAVRHFEAARAIMEQKMTGPVLEAARHELDRARDAWIPLQGTSDGAEKFRAWLFEDKKNQTALICLDPDAGGDVDANGWSPIEVVSIDTTIDLWHPEGGRHPNCRWVKDPDEPHVGWWEQQYAEADSWARMPDDWRPTHWRHVPKDPVPA